MTMRWHIARTEPHAEGKAAAGLVGRRFNVYVPYELRAHRVGRERKRVVELAPMMPGYLLIRLDPTSGQWRRVRDVPGVAGFLEYEDGRKATISDDAMALLQLVEAEQNIPEVREWPFRVGDTVEVGREGGIHEGLCGKLERIDKSDHATLSIVLPARVWTIITSASWLQRAS